VVSNTCDNSYYSLSVEERILKAIDKSELEMAPHEIAKEAHAKRSTVRVILRKLLDKGLIVQPYPGAYCNKITHGMRFVPRMVHNIRLSSFVCQNLKHDVVDERVGSVELHVVFGEERRKVSGWIKCDAGMSYDACMFALNRWFDVAEGRLHFCLSDLKLTCFEVNKDYHGVRVEGVQCLTRSDLFGMIERFYQKENNVLRQEFKVTKPTSINEFEAHLKNGLDNAEKAQNVFETQREIALVKDALKFNNSRMLDVERLLEQLVKHSVEDREAAEKLRPLGREGDYSR
jgi:predicted transcriptional regulator